MLFLSVLFSEMFVLPSICFVGCRWTFKELSPKTLAELFNSAGWSAVDRSPAELKQVFGHAVTCIS